MLFPFVIANVAMTPVTNNIQINIGTNERIREPLIPDILAKLMILAMMLMIMRPILEPDIIVSNIN